MRKRDIDARVGAVQRPSPEAVEALPLGAAESEFVAAIVAQPQERAADDPGRATEPTMGPRRLAPRPRIARRSLGLLATGAAALLLIAIATDRGPGGAPSPAFGAELVRMAKASPLVLLDAPGWQVGDTTQGPASGGAMHFFRADPKGGRSTAELRWRRGRMTNREIERRGVALIVFEPAILDRRWLTIRQRGRPGHLAITAVWEDHGRVLYFRSVVPDLPTFKDRLGSLRRVGAAAWLGALPPSVVKAAERNSG